MLAKPTTKIQPAAVKAVVLCLLFVVSTQVNFSFGGVLSQTNTHPSSASSAIFSNHQGNQSLGWANVRIVPNYNLPTSADYVVDSDENTIITMDGTNSITLNGSTYNNAGGSYNTCFVISYIKI